MIRIGMFFGDRYEILEKIGSGGMSDVFKGKDHKLNRLVAIKVLKDEFVEDKNFVRKFKEEAQAAAALAHPNIVNVYDVGDEQNAKYIVMELVEGITLKNYIERKGRLTVKEATSIAIQVSSGLEVAHNNHIIHRDIKPQNIMISKEGKVKVTDFGIAKSVSANTNTSAAMGSVHYTSPEQARGGYSDSKSDIYSLGIVLYEMVTGRVPFDGETTVVVAVKHLQEEMVSPRVYASDVPVSLEQIIMKCTEKSPDRRYANIGELIADLKQSLITPDVNFIKPVMAGGAKTVAITEDDLGRIKREINSAAGTGLAGGVLDVEHLYADMDDDEEDEDYENNAEETEDEDDEDEGMDRRLEKIMTIGGIAAAVIIVIIIFVIIFKLFGIGKSNDGNNETPKDDINIEDVLEDETVEVPDLTGKSYSEAKDLLNELGLGIAFGETRESDDYEEGQIMDQDIEAGTEVEKNTTIKVDICSGGEKVAVLDVVGLTEANATANLTSIGLSPDVVTSFSDTVAKGKVISTTPKAGVPVEKGSVVKVVISKGPDKKMVEMPDLVGRPLSRALEKLEEANLEQGTISQEYSYTIPKDYVAAQKTEAGKEVEEGTLIDFTVSKGLKIKVGKYAGMTEANAIAALDKLFEGAGVFTYTVEYEFSDAVTKGYVLSTSIADDDMTQDQTLTVTVSKGSKNAGVTIPNVIGKTESEAIAALGEVGLYASVTGVYGTLSDKGTVVSQDIGTAAKGDTIEISVSIGPKECDTHTDVNTDGTCDVCGKTGLSTGTATTP